MKIIKKTLWLLSIIFTAQCSSFQLDTKQQDLCDVLTFVRNSKIMKIIQDEQNLMKYLEDDLKISNIDKSGWTWGKINWQMKKYEITASIKQDFKYVGIYDFDSKGMPSKPTIRAVIDCLGDPQAYSSVLVFNGHHGDDYFFGLWYPVEGISAIYNSTAPLPKPLTKNQVLGGVVLTNSYSLAPFKLPRGTVRSEKIVEVFENSNQIKPFINLIDIK